jgi:N-acetylglucosaminyldiphosphoundecaprenol N-acetyl-beta-D-mannosaminyltransferase
MNMHALYCVLKNTKMSELFFRPETRVHIDGMPIVWMLKLKGHFLTPRHRLGYIDWFVDLMELAASKGWRVAYIGSTPQTCASGVSHFQKLFPKLEISGWDGFFDLNDCGVGSKLDSTIAQVNRFKADILVVGMGMPRQEIFLSDHIDDLDCKVALCSGGYFDYFGGNLVMAPRWIGDIGMEWLLRLVLTPRRTAFRYLVEPWLIIFMLLKKKFR